MTVLERRPPWRGSGLHVGPYATRLLVVGALLAAGLWAVVTLRVGWTAIWPGPGGWRLAHAFFGRIVHPALTYQGADVPISAPPILLQAARAAWLTVVFAAASMVPGVLLGLVLGFGGASAWWATDRERGAREGRRRLQVAAIVGPAISGACRLVAVIMRSVHELLWAVLFLAAFGITPLSALLALALPYAGTLAKVFAELIDEAPRDAAGALREAGASPVQVFCFGLLPRALPDMIAYTLYRFECALRSSAVLGFFGFPTLGYFIAASFENLYFGEVWTYLDTLIVLVVLVDWWSGAIRRRLVT